MALQFRYSTRELEAGVRRAMQEQPRKAQRAMRDVSMLLAKEVKRRTPVDEGHLTNSVTAEVVQYRKSWAATVYIPINSQAAPYAVWLHEGQYNLGKNSLAKQGKTNCAVGPKYITRAIDDNRGRILDLLRDAMKV